MILSLAGMKILICALLGALLTVFAASCSAPKTNPAELLRDTTWSPMFLPGTKNLKIPNDANNPVFIHFSKDYKICGMSGVNRFFGSCELERKKLRRSECKVKWSAIGATKMAGEFMDYEAKFLEALNSTDTIRLSANHLEFLKGGKLLIEFKRIPNLSERNAESQK